MTLYQNNVKHRDKMSKYVANYLFENTNDSISIEVYLSLLLYVRMRFLLRAIRINIYLA
jgi:hypothetical protein